MRSTLRRIAVVPVVIALTSVSSFAQPAWRASPAPLAPAHNGASATGPIVACALRVASLAQASQQPSLATRSRPSCLERVAFSMGFGLLAGLPIGFAAAGFGGGENAGREIGRVMLIGAGAGLVAGAVWCAK